MDVQIKFGEKWELQMPKTLGPAICSPAFKVSKIPYHMPNVLKKEKKRKEIKLPDSICNFIFGFLFFNKFIQPPFLPIKFFKFSALWAWKHL